MPATSDKKYIEGIGRRKESVARVRLTPATNGSMTVNDKPLAEHLKTTVLQSTALAALKKVDKVGKYDVTVVVNGGGVASQAESIRLGVARALIEEDIELRGDLKKAGYLKRDPRKKERYKFGLKKARKSAQWSKR